MSSEVSPQRRESVEKARQDWIRKLIDLSRRNNLLYYRALKWGTLNLSLEDTERWGALLQGESVALRSFATGLTEDDLLRKVVAIWRRAQANQEEKGLATMFVALGMAGWKASDEGRDSDAPVLLLPVTIELRGHAGTSLAIRRTGVPQANLVLLHVLQTEFGVSISNQATLVPLEGHEEGEVFDPSAVYDLFRKECGRIPGFQIREVAVLGNFAFQKMAMVRDLQESAELLVGNDLIAALAGDSEAKQSIDSKIQNPEPREFDKIPPQSEFLILDADSSQQSAIAAVIAGQSAVIHGPPGTGKSQTIANLVATLAAAGSRVLFVAEKRAALQVVLKRLQQVGLDKIAIDLHGADVSSKRVTEQLSAALSAVRQAVPVDCERMHQQYVERRERLNRHVEKLHRKRRPGDKSVYELQGTLLRYQCEPDIATRWRGPELTKIENAEPARIRDLLRDAGGLASLFLRTDPSPWNGISLADGGAAQRAVDLVASLSSNTWPEFVSSLTSLASLARFSVPKTLNEAQRMYSLLNAVAKTAELYNSELFKRDIQGMIRGLAPGKRGGFRAFWAWCTSGEYRRARKEALGYRIAGKVRACELFTEMTAAEDERIKWIAMSKGSSSPRLLDDYTNGHRKLELAAADVKKLFELLDQENSDSRTLDEIVLLVDALAKDRLTPMKLPRLHDLEQGLYKAGAEKLIEEIRKKQLAAEKWALAFDHCWYSSCLEAAQAEDPDVAGFNGRTHDTFVQEFKDLDRERIQVAAARVRRAYAERAVSAMNQYRAEEYLIRSEAEKKRRHRSIRSLFAEAPHVLTSLCPCWMASPLSVSQLLNATQAFDFVIFDEASQVLPEDAIPAILRGSHLVVAGDRWQLPPTIFFASSDDDDFSDEESNAATGGFESLLDVTCTFMPSWHLNWHYRSRDEALISFSNHYIYQDRLVTFPGPGQSTAIQHVLAEQPLGVDGQEESCSEEVNKVVDLVLGHAEKRPRESLGVIAMGIRHADRVQRAIDQALTQRPDLGQFFDANLDERFFVKNLERVQGDERDAIILTIGYGKDRGGNLPFRFGPLLSLGGQRRLNVAVTRARNRLTLVSSFSHFDMDPSKVKSGTGVELLRNYLEYASSGGKRLGDVGSTSFPMNSFEAEVFDVLTSKGVPLISQCGSSNYRIDLVAQHPKRPGRHVLAIECDGASYHSSPTARDRDRLRQQQLENLGWKFHRIWSTDWFMRKEEEVNRALTAYRNAVSFADDADQRVESSAVGTRSENPLALSTGSSSSPSRGARPNVGRREAITDYSEPELVAMVNWIESDGRLRTDDQIIDELLPELGFQRRGARIQGTLLWVLQQRRAKPPHKG